MAEQAEVVSALRDLGFTAQEAEFWANERGQAAPGASPAEVARAIYDYIESANAPALEAVASGRTTRATEASMARVPAVIKAQYQKSTVQELGGEGEVPTFSEKQMDSLRNEVTDALVEGTFGQGGVAPYQGASDEVVAKWFEANETRFQGWAFEGRTPDSIVEMVRRDMTEEAKRRIQETINEYGSSVSPETLAAVYGDLPINAAEISVFTQGAAQLKAQQERIHDDPRNIALAQSYGFGLDDPNNAVRLWMEYAQEEMLQSGNDDLRTLAEANTLEQLFTFVTEGNLQNMGEDGEGVARRIFNRVEDAKAFHYGQENALVMERDWMKVQNIDGFGETNQRLVRQVFEIGAESGVEEPAEYAGYVALLAKERGLLTGKDRWSQVSDALPEAFGIGQRGRNTVEQFIKGVIGGVWGEFQRAVDRYGRPELALIAIDDPALAERIFENGSPQNDEEAHRVRQILGRYDEQDLATAGFNQGMSAYYVEDLLSVGGAAAASGGLRTVVQADPRTLEEGFRATWRTLLMAEPDDAAVAAFVQSVQNQEVAAVNQANSQVRAAFNKWKGTGGLSAGSIDQIHQQFDVDPNAEALERLRGSTTYRALYRGLPAGMSEEDYLSHFRAKVGQAVGADDVGQYTDAIQSGMMEGDARAAQQRAIYGGALSDETLRGKMATLGRTIRNMV